MIRASTKHIMNRRMITRGRTARGVTELQELQNYTLPRSVILLLLQLLTLPRTNRVLSTKSRGAAQHKKQKKCCVRDTHQPLDDRQSAMLFYAIYGFSIFCRIMK